MTPSRVYLEGLANRPGTGAAEAVKLLTVPEWPDALEYLYRWTHQLARSRQIGMHGPERITYTDIDAWARLTGVRPTPAEVDALLVLDAVMLNPGAGPEEEDG